MSKKPLPPRRDPRPVQSETPDVRPEISNLGRPIAHNSIMVSRDDLEALLQRSRSKVEPTPASSSFARHCPADEDRFNQLAGQMKDEGWELVSVVPHKKYVTISSGSGMSDGWMTFWKRNLPHKEESKS